VRGGEKGRDLGRKEEREGRKEEKKSDKSVWNSARAE
jgi:hypothetical protein